MTQPSLTPYRDCVEQIIARLDAPQNWIDAMSIAMTSAVQRMVADQLDAGRQRADILIVMPTVFRAAAQALGLRLENHQGRGHSLHQVVAAEPPP